MRSVILVVATFLACKGVFLEGLEVAFIVVTVGALFALGLAGVIADADRSAWWVVPGVVGWLLSISVLRATPKQTG